MTRFVMGGLFAAVACGLTGCPPGAPPDAPPLKEFRTMTGVGNNAVHPDWGSADRVMRRETFADYADGVSTPSGGDRPSARAVSNMCAAQSAPNPNDRGLSDFFWQWGQFLDHDLDLAPVFDPIVPFDIPVPRGDAYFDPFATGAESIALDRSYHEISDGVAEQVNEITAYIDGSNVYGSDDERATALRTLDGTGRLKTSAGGLLPFNTDGLPNAPSDSPAFFLAGDFRANEQAYLTAMHTLWLREHNFHADRILADHPNWDGDTIYNMARAMVVAEMQSITFRDFLPILLGPDALPPYRGYRETVKPDISNEFATAAYRFGHTMLSSQLLRLDENLEEIPEGHLPLANAFFDPTLVPEVGVEPFLRGLAWQRAQTVDPFLVNDVRNFLFGPPGAGGFDLASLNIQRGRDHGLPDYNSVRAALGLGRVSDFDEISRDPTVQANLAGAYGNVDRIDLWVGGLSETPVNGALVGPTFREILRRQFAAVRDGDRFWFETYLPGPMLDQMDKVTLADVIRRNTTIRNEIPDNVFLVPPR